MHFLVIRTGLFRTRTWSLLRHGTVTASSSHYSEISLEYFNILKRSLPIVRITSTSLTHVSPYRYIVNHIENIVEQRTNSIGIAYDISYVFSKPLLVHLRGPYTNVAYMAFDSRFRIPGKTFANPWQIDKGGECTTLLKRSQRKTYFTAGWCYSNPSIRPFLIYCLLHSCHPVNEDIWNMS